jgi:hypothetical protein
MHHLWGDVYRGSTSLKRMQYNKNNNQQHKKHNNSNTWGIGLGEYLGMWWTIVTMWWNSTNNTMEQLTNIFDQKHWG